jgi:hypothetical protein
MFEVPEDPSSDAKSVGFGMKMCTKAHDELNVRPYHHEIQEGVNHAPLLSLVDSLALFI